MKFILNSIVEGVTNGYNILDECIYFIQNGVLCKYTNKGLCEEITPITIRFVKSLIFNNHNIIVIGSSCVEIYNVKNSEKTTTNLPGTIGRTGFTDDLNIPLVVHNVDGSRYSVLYNLLDSQVVWQSNSTEILRALNNRIYSISSSRIILHNNLTGKEVMIHDFISDIKTIPEVYFVNEEFVLFGSSRAETLILESIKNKKILWSKFYSGNGVKYSNDRDCVHILSGGHTVYDLLSGKELFPPTSVEYMRKLDFFSFRNNYKLHTNFIITTNNKSKVGMLDYNKNELVWIYDSEGATFPPSKPIIFKDRFLLISDSKNRLHIFNRVDNDE